MYAEKTPYQNMVTTKETGHLRSTGLWIPRLCGIRPNSQAKQSIQSKLGAPVIFAPFLVCKFDPGGSRIIRSKFRLIERGKPLKYEFIHRQMYHFHERLNVLMINYTYIHTDTHIYTYIYWFGEIAFCILN